jgi:cellulose synthase operon protein C
MQVVRSVRLWMTEGSSDKLYEVDLIDLERADVDARYLVNFRYGRRGTSLRDGTKTSSPVTRSNVSKINGGYRRIEGDAPPLTVIDASVTANGRDTELLKKLAICARSTWPDKERDRLFWRLGVIRLASAYPQLSTIAEKIGAANASYSLVYALARCGGANAVDLLRSLADVNVSLVTRDYAAYALASELMGARRLPPRLLLPRTTDAAATRDIEMALMNGDGARLVQVLAAASSAHPGFANEFLIALAHHALADSAARKTLLAAVHVMNPRPPYVQVLRRLFKYADLTDDGPLFAATARQFELATPMYRRGRVYNDRVWVAGSRQALKLSEELRSTAPRIALSDQTLLYFKRRAWRMLRKRAELGQDAFTAMASELLLAFTDADGIKPATWTQHARIDGRFHPTPHATGALSRVWSISHLLHAGAETSRFNVNALTHRHVGARAPAQREEAFPGLWDAQPQRLLRIATLARNHAAARFAAEALRQGPPRPDTMDAAAVGGLLASPYSEVTALAAEISRRLVDAGKAEAALIAALLETATQDMRDLAIRAIDDRADWPWADPVLARAAMTSSHDHVQGRTRGWLRDRTPSRDQRARTTEAFAAWLAQLPSELDDEQRAGVAAAVVLLPQLWPDRDCPLQPEVIESLTGHASSDVQAASIELIAVTPTRPSDLPPAFWQAILQADAPEIRIASMTLLARLDDAALAHHRDGITLAATGAHAGLRTAARPLVARIAANDEAYAVQLRDMLMAGFFRAEPVERHAADMVTLFADALPQAAAAIDEGTLWRLLQARAAGARMMGAKLLESRAASRFSIRQLARLGNHSFAAVRRFALDAFANDEARFRADPQNAVLLVESEWDDVRATAVNRLTAWPSDALPAAALAVMADSTVPAVQDGARLLLRRSLAEGDVAGVLGRVLEHPSGSFHLFVTELITGDSLADAAIFTKFLIQARIILMQINRGRIAKDRIFTALRNEALAHRDRAAAITPLLHDFTLSVTLRDKAPALMILRDIALAWPDLTLPVTVTRAGRTPSGGGSPASGNAA